MSYSFTANPFDLTGTLDTSQPDGQNPGFQTIPTSVEDAGAALGAESIDTADNSAASVCDAFRMSDDDLATAAANRVFPGEVVSGDALVYEIPSPSAP